MEFVNTFLGTFILSFATMQASKIILEYKILSKTRYIAITLIFGIIYGLLSIFFDGTFKSIVCMLAQSIAFFYQFRISFLKGIFISLMSMLLILMSEIFIIIFFIEILKIDSNYFYDVFSNGIYANCIISFMFLLFIFLFRKMLIKLLNLKIEENVKNIIYLILTFICVVIIFYKAMVYIEFNFETMSILLLMGTFIIIISSYLKERINNNKLSEKYDKLWEYMKIFEKEIEKQRIYNHEIKNQFLTIKSICLETKNNSEVRKYVEDILGDERTIMNEEYAKFKDLPANGLKGLMYFKCDEAKEKGIDVSIMISKSVKNSVLYNLSINKTGKLCKLLGIYIDNAIEASYESDKKKLGIEVIVKKEDVIVIISNTFKGSVSDNIGRISFSTKGKNRGHGLLLAKSIIESSNVFEASKEVLNELYVQKLIIKKS